LKLHLFTHTLLFHLQSIVLDCRQYRGTSNSSRHGTGSGLSLFMKTKTCQKTLPETATISKHLLNLVRRKKMTEVTINHIA